MTSPEFLNDKVNISDFKRSLKSAVLFPIIALVVLSLNFLTDVIGYVTILKQNHEEMAALKSGNIISYFGGREIIPEVMTLGMVLCGIIMAVRLFSFAFKKNSVNVYFSMGITRTTLFLNRILAAAIELFAASLLPFLAIFLTNVIVFGFNGHQFSLLLYYTFSMFVSGLAGLSIGSFAAAVSGSVAEMIITTAASSTVVSTFISAYGMLQKNFLRGYVSVANSTLSKLGQITSPFSFIGNYGKYTSYDKSGFTSPLAYLGELTQGKKVPDGLKITGMIAMPLIVWIIFSAVICVLGLWLFNKRKNENAHSIGKFAVPSALVCACVFAYFGESVMEFVEYTTYLSDHRALSVALFIVATFLACFIGLLIYRRKIKGVLKMLPVYGGILAVSLIAVVFVFTDNFGTFNKLPDISEIEFVSMGYTDPLGAFSYNTSLRTPDDYDNKEISNCKSSNKADIELCVELWNKIKDDKRTKEGAVDYIDIVIKTKDGKYISRDFPVYSKDLAVEYSKKVFNSDYFDNILKLNLEGNGEETSEDYISGVDYYPEYGYDGYYGEYTHYGMDIYYYYDGELVADKFSDYYWDFSDEVSPHNVTPELISALYEEISAMTYDEYYKNENAPIGGIATSNTPLKHTTDKYTIDYGWFEFYHSSEDSSKYDSMAYANNIILIYPQMEKTLAALGEFEPMSHDIPVKEVIYTDAKLSIEEIMTGLDMNYGSSSSVFVTGNVWGESYFYYSTSDKIKKMFDDKTEGVYLDVIETLYASEDVRLVHVTDSEKAEEIVNSARSVYDTAGDNGRYVYVILENNAVYEKYLPEKELGVLK